MCDKMKFKTYILLFSASFFNVSCNEQNLRSDSIVYGLSTVNITAENTLCTYQLNEFVQAANNRTVWALKIMDASGVPNSGFLWGNNFWVGQRVLCSYITDRRPIAVSDKLPVYHNITDDDFAPYALSFYGAYVQQNLTIQQHYNISEYEDRITIGLCLPSTCGINEVKKRLQRYLDEHTLNIQKLYMMDMTVVKIKNLDESYSRYSLSLKLMVIILTFIILMAIIGTTYDVKVNGARKLAKQNLEDAITSQNENNEKTTNNQTSPQEIPSILQTKQASQSIGSKILLAFSLDANIKSLFKTSKESPNSLPFVHGFRFGSMLWVITVHAILYQRNFMANPIVAYRLSDEWYNGPYSSGEISVDSFFFLSGFLAAYLFYKSNLKKIEDVTYTFSQKLLHFTMAIVSKYLRYTPVMLILIIIFIVNFQYYEDRFIVEIDEHIPENCSKYWWRNILYINNWFAVKDMCLTWTWFLSADMQFLVITLALLYLSLTHLVTAFIIMGVLAISSCLSAMYIVYQIQFIPTLDENLNTMTELYQPSWTRISPYIVGAFTGYYAVKLNGKLDWKQSTIKLCWILGPLLNLSILFCLWDRKISLVASALYTGLHRILWAVGLAWLFIACSTNNAGIINKILSFHGFVPMSRLTLCSYLLNPFLILSYNLGIEEGFTVGQFTIGRAGFMIMLTAYLTSFLVSIFIEMPSYQLTKLILFKKIEKPDSSNNNLTK